jgi:hypothetical protein
MTEVEWMACEDPDFMICACRKRLSNRKLRLFAVGCCRRVWSRLATNRQKKAVELAEKFADRLITREQFRRSRRAALVSESGGLAAEVVNYALHNDAVNAARYTAGNASALSIQVERGLNAVELFLRYPGISEHNERRAQASLLRCIASPRYQLPPIKPAWRTSDVLAVAGGIYEDRAFERMPILADALQDAGCDNEEVLAHCREPNPHARGCWVVDLLLGKQ